MMVSQEMGTQPIQVLMVEDSPGDVRLTQEALRMPRYRSGCTSLRMG